MDSLYKTEDMLQLDQIIHTKQVPLQFRLPSQSPKLAFDENPLFLSCQSNKCPRPRPEGARRRDSCNLAFTFSCISVYMSQKQNRIVGAAVAFRCTFGWVGRPLTHFSRTSLLLSSALFVSCARCLSVCLSARVLQGECSNYTTQTHLASTS